MSVRKLPLWKNLLESMEAGGIEYGKVYDAAYFEGELSCGRNSMQFGLAVHHIRVALEHKGFYLQGHAQRSGTMVIVPATKHVGIARNVERRIRKGRRRAIVLLSETERAALPKKFHAAHDRALERMEIRELLELRAGRVHRVLLKKAPKVLGIGR